LFNLLYQHYSTKDNVKGCGKLLRRNQNAKIKSRTPKGEARDENGVLSEHQNERLKCKKSYFLLLRVITLAPITLDISSASFKSCSASALKSGTLSFTKINQYFVSLADFKAISKK